MKKTRKIRRTTTTKTTAIYFRLQRKSRILMLNINENCRNRRRKRLFDCYKQCKRLNILTANKHQKSQLPPMLSIILPFIFLLTLTTTITTTNTRTMTSVYAQPTQNQASGSSNDDEELSKTMNGIGDEDLNLNLHSTATSSSTIQQPQLSSNNHINNESHENESQQQEHQERNEHSIKSIWTPTDGNHDESLASSADLMRQPKGDEEFAGHAEPSELNRQFISVLNNQSDIVFNNNTKHELGNELQHATTFLLGKSTTASTSASTLSQTSNSQTNNNANNNNNSIGIENGNNDDNNCNNSNNNNENRTSSNENSLSGGRFSDGLFTSPSSIRMIQFESQSNNVTTGNNNLISPSQMDQIISTGNSMLETNNFALKANAATKQRAHYLKPGKKRKKARPSSMKAGYIKQNKLNKSLNSVNGDGNGNSYNSNYSNSTNMSSGDVGSKMISYSLVPTAAAATAITTTNRPKLASFSVLNKQDLESQMMLAATSSPIRSIVMPNKQNQIYQQQQQQQQHQQHQISPPATTSSVSNRNIALIFPNGAIGSNFGDTSSSGSNQIKLPTVSSPPTDGRDLAAAAAAFADQFGSSSSSLVSPPVINNNANNNKESFIFDSSNNVLQKQFTTTGGFGSLLSGKNMPDATLSSGLSSSHLFPSSLSSSYASPSASTISTTAAAASPSKSSYPLSVIDPATRASLFEQLRRSPQNNKGGHMKQSLALNEFLITSSSSHQPNEFETTLKQQPEHQHEPIVQVQDGSNAIEANSSEVSLVSPSLTSSQQQQQPNTSSSLDDLGGDDDEGPDNDSMDPFEITHGGDFDLKNESINGQDQDGKPTRLDVKPQQQQQQQQQLANEQNLYKQQQKPVNTDTELLVGPFKSESEAPATITLSGVVYQKSGASSSFIRQTSGKPEHNDNRENLSTSGSQQATSSSATTNNNRIVQLKPNSGGNKILDSSQFRGFKIEDLLNQADKNWPYSGNSPIFQSLQGATSSTSTNPQLGSINEILLSSIKPTTGETMSIDSIKDSSSVGGSSSLLSSFQLPDSYTGLSGGIRLGPFPWSPASLLSNSFFGSGSSQFLDDLTAQKMTKGAIDQQASTLSADHAPIWGSSSTKSSSSSVPTLVSGTTATTSGLAGKLTSGGNKLAESYYLGGSMNAAASDSHYHSKQKDKGPIVIVQKDVKPVKYHLMRAYLKLRRLLRPFEATYVFLNDRNSFVKRKQTARQTALKGSRKSIVSSLDTESFGMFKTLESPSKMS